MEPNSHQIEVEVMWNGIIWEWFPGRERYMVYHNLSTPAPADAREALFEAVKIVDIPEETDAADTPEIWEETVNGQFLEDLSAFNKNASQRVFGAIAIGTKVRFYKYDGKNSSALLMPLHDETFDLRTENDVVEVEKTLGYVKAEGWDWANSEPEIGGIS
ncbi:hypothetical protein N7493_011992 [Penicillium malachiteum]|uniref:Uncharacterized protein n=1 Tax=Penicillium malachiteum TaxID=1324776 RepID=A0AAD6MPZ9_9EURO|nr:hypothetical protein N7493_011992 [Penicillium malachiteum]